MFHIVNILFFNKKREIALDLKDKNGKRVVWYKESYDAHVKAKHFDVNSCQDKIKKAISSPQLKAIDTKRKNTRYYYEVRKDKRGNTLFIRVAVDYNHNPAFVRTAHLTTDISGASITY